MKKIVFLLAFGFTALVTYGQTAAKIGFADTEYIFSQIPESKQIETELQTLQAQLKKQYDGKVAEYQKKAQEFETYGAGVPDAVKQNTQRELQQLIQNIQKLEQDSQENLQRKHAQLMEPVQAKIGKAIEDVAKENGFSMILINQLSGLDVVLYADDKSDISDLVLKKMGITPQASTANPPKN